MQEALRPFIQGKDVVIPECIKYSDASRGPATTKYKKYYSIINKIKLKNQK